MLWCSDGCGEETVWSRLRLAICPRWDSPAQWWAEWNLYSGQVCPARGYLSPSTEQSRGAQTEFYQEWWNSQLCSTQSAPAQTGPNVYFLVEKCPQFLMNKYFTTRRRTDWGAIEQAMNGQSKDCSPLSSPPPDSSGMWLPLHTLALHISPRQISWLPQTSALLGGRAISVSDEVTISYNYLPAPALPLICIVFTQLSPGANS